MKSSQIRAAFARAIRASNTKDDWGRAVVRGELAFMDLPCEVAVLLDVIVMAVGGRKQVKGCCSVSVFNCGGEPGAGVRGSIHFVVSETGIDDGMHYFEVALADAKTQLARSAEFVARAERAQLAAAHPAGASAQASRPRRL